MRKGKGMRLHAHRKTHIPYDSLINRLLGWVFVELLTVIFAVDIIAHPNKLSVAVETRE